MTPAQLRARLAALGWTQRHLAKMLGVTERTVSRWLAGSTPVPLHCQRYLARPFPSDRKRKAS